MTDNTENAGLVPVDAQPQDERGRVLPFAMSDRELLLELVTHMRTLADTVEELAESPMVQALQGGGNPIMAMFGR